MEKVLWYLIAGTRGGETRARIIRALDDRPHNANQLASHLDLEYNTIRYHLDMLIDHGILETGGDDYGKLYFLTDQFEHHHEKFGQIVARMDFETDIAGRNEPTEQEDGD